MFERHTVFRRLLLVATLSCLAACGKDETATETPAEPLVETGSSTNAEADSTSRSIDAKTGSMNVDADRATNTGDDKSLALTEQVDQALAGGQGEPPLVAALPEIPTASAGEADLGSNSLSTVPYEVYPNGQQYRVGSENGLRIVLMQTRDDFDSVDTFYQKQTESGSLNRLPGMEGYVRYSAQSGDEDPWATHKPGIVVHQFTNTDEALAVGADPESRTNIIYSY